MRSYIALILLILGITTTLKGQHPGCDPGVPHFNVDLSGNPDSAWVSAAVVRNEFCCGESNPRKCVSFTLTLDSSAQGFKFDVVSGAMPGGSLFYEIDCGGSNPVGDPICLPGPGPYQISFCKPGNNLNEYGITSIAAPEASPPQVVADGCAAQMYVTNMEPGTIQWSALPDDPADQAQFDGYMDCTTCDTVNLDISGNLPDTSVKFIDYQVIGVPAGGCVGLEDTLTVRVFFVFDKFVEILPKDPVICFGGITASVTANPNGGAPPYEYVWSTGETTQSINVGVGTYSVLMYDSTNCPPVMDSVTVTANPSPISADAGGPYIGCQNNPDVTLNGSVIVATGGQWSGYGGTFAPNNDTTLNAVYTPSAAELTQGFAVLTLSTTGNGICPVSQDFDTIYYDDSPIVNPGGPYTVCSNNAQVVLNGSVTNAGGGRWSGGLGTFSPHDSALNVTYTPDPGEIIVGTPLVLTLTSIQNGSCLPESATVNINFTESPIVDAGPPQTVCANNAQVTLAGVVGAGGVGPTTTGTWTNLSGSFTSNNLTDTYTPTSAEITAGSAQLILTSTNNGTCLAEDDTLDITITPAPIVDAGLPQTVCANNNTLTLNGMVTLDGLAHTGTWSGGTNNFVDPTILNTDYTSNSSAGSEILTLTSSNNGNCLAVSDSVEITVTPAPVVNAGLDDTVCTNAPDISLNGSITVAPGGTWSNGGGSFNTSNTDLTGTYTPTAGELTAGTVILILTSDPTATCLPEDDTVEFLLAPSPTANAGLDDTVCTNDLEANLNGSVTIASGGTWSGGSGTFNPDNTTLNAGYTPGSAEISAGSATLTLTTTGNGICAAATDQIIIEIEEEPIVNAGPNQVLCATAPDVVLAGSINTNSGVWPGGGIWTGGNGSFSTNNTDLTATYTPTATEIANGTLNLILTSTNNGSCIPDDDTLTITFVPGPVANAGNDTAVCANNVQIQLNGSIQNATGGIWFGNGGQFLPDNTTLDANYVPTSAELSFGFSGLILQTTGNGVCPPDLDTMLISYFSAATVNAGPDVFVCENNSLASLNGTTSVNSNPASTFWFGGNGTFTPDNTNKTPDYTPTATEISNSFVDLILTTNRDGCLPVFDTIRVNISPSPIVNAGVDQTVCANNSQVTLNGSVIADTATGQWSNFTGSISSSTDLNATYTPSSAEITAGFADLILTSTNNGACLPVSDTMRIIINPAPLVDAGPDDSTCANNAGVTLNGNVIKDGGTPGTGTWIGGLGTFTPNRNVLNPTYIPTAGEITTGSIELILSSTNNGLCNPVSDTINIFISDAPTVEAGPDTTVCADNPSVPLQGEVDIAGGGTWTGGNGTFNPNANTLNAVYTPSAGEITAGSVTLTLISTNNEDCNPVSDVMTITITDPPEVDAGSDQDVCGDLSAVSLNGSVLRANGGIWTTSGTGTFSPSDTALNASYTPTSADTAAGSVTLTLTTTGNNGCNSRSDDVVLTFVTAPTVEAGPNQTVCTTDLPVQLAGGGSISNWSSPTGGTFNPGTGSLNATYQPSAADLTNGTVTLTLTTVPNAFCPSISDNVNLFFPTGPTVNAGQDTTVCGFNSDITLNGQFTVAGAVRWTIASGTGGFDDDTDPNAIYTFTATDKLNGSVSLILTTELNGPCDPVSDTINITILEEIVAFAGNDQTACADASGVGLGGSIQGASGGIWTTSGDGNFTPSDTALNGFYIPSNNDTANGSVTLTLTSTGNSGCPADADDMVLTITPAPTVNAGPDTTTICADNAGVSLNGSVTVATGGQWYSSGTGTFSPASSLLTTTYIPSDQDTANGIVELILESTNNGTCNPVYDTIYIEILPVPVVNTGPDQSVCADNLIVNLSGSVLHAGGGTWTTSGNGTFTPNANDLNASYNLSSQDSAAGLIVLTLTSTQNGLCNAYDDQMLINITPAPTISAGNDVDVCASQDSISLNGNVTIASGGQWSSSGTGSFVPSDTALNGYYLPSDADTTLGSIVLTLTSIGNGTCQPVSDQINVNFQSLPIVDAGADTTVCSDISSIGLNASFSNAGGIVWSSNGTGSFSPSSTDPNASYQPSNADSLNGTVTLTLTSTTNLACPAASDDKIITLTPGVVVSVGNDLTVCADTAGVPLNGSVTNAAGGFWSTTGTGSFSPDSSDLNATYIPSALDTAAGSVSLLLTSTGNGGCLARNDNLTINIIPTPTVFAGPDQTQCISTGSISLNGDIANAGGGIWSTVNGTGSFSPDNVSLGGTYLVTSADTAAGFVDIMLTTTGNGLCKAYTDTFRTTFDPLVEINAGPDTSICVDVAGLQLNGSFANAAAATWSTSGTGTFSPDANDANAVYVPSAADKTAGGVTITYTSNIAVACPDRSDDLILTITPAPIVNAGLDDTLCISSPTVNLNGSITNAGGGIWTTASGQGTFNSGATSLSGTFTPSATQLSTGSVILTLTSTGNGTCNSRNDQKTIRFQNLPVANAGPDQIVCADNPAINISGTITGANGGRWSSGGSGTFNPDVDSLIAQYIYSNADELNGTVNLFLLSTGNGACPADRDTVVLTITPAPTINATASNNCADESGVQLAGAITISSGLQWSSSGTGVFTPNLTSNNVLFTPSAADIIAGSVTIYLTSTGNGNCTAVVDSSVILSLNEAPSANAGNDRVICADQTSVNLNGSIANSATAIWTATGGGAFTPSANSLSAQYTPTALDRANGTVKIYLTTNDPSICNQAVDSLIVTITPAPTVDAGNSQTLCANRDTVDVTATFTIASGVGWSTAGSGTFNDTSLTSSQYYPSAADKIAGSVYLIATTTGNGLCNPVQDSVLITLTPETDVNIGNDLSVCSRDDTIFFTASLTVANGGLWSTSGNGQFLPGNTANNIRYILDTSDINNGSVSLFYVTTSGNGDCFPARDTVNITIDPEAEVNITLPNLCTADDSISLIGDTTNINSFYWSSNGTGVYSPDTNTALDVFYIRSIADSIAGTATVYLFGTGAASCGEVVDSIQLNLSPPPDADAGPDQIVCQDTSGVDLAGVINNAGGGFWTALNGNGTFTVDSTDLTGQYLPNVLDTAQDSIVVLLTSTGNGACDADVDTLNITVTPAPTVDAGPAIVCSNIAVTPINGTITIATGGIWTTAGDGVFADSSQLSTTYTVGPNDITNGTVTLTLTSTGNGSCNTYSDNIVVNVANAPEADAGVDSMVCGDRVSIQLDGDVVNAGGAAWTTLGNGTFNDTSLIDPIYFFDPLDVQDDSVIFVMQTTGNGTCLPDFDTMIVYFTSIPQVTVTTGVVCSNNATVNIEGTVTVATGSIWSNPAGTGGIFGDVNDTSTTYQPSATDITNGSVTLVLTSQGNGDCQAYSDSVDLIITPPPTVDAGSPQNVCADTSFIQLAGLIGGAADSSIWSSNGTGLLSDSSVLNATYIPSQADLDSGSVVFFLLTQNDENCNDVLDSVEITIGPAPSLTVIDTQIVCADTTGIQVTASVNFGDVIWSTPNGTGNFNGGTNILNPIYEPSNIDTTNGFVTLIVQSDNVGNCKELTDTVNLIITPAPTLDPGGSPLCSDNAVIPLNAAITVSTAVQWTSSGTGSFAPNAQSPSTSYIRSSADSAAGNVTLTVQTTGSGSCKELTDSIEIFLIPAPTANAGADIQICDAQIVVPVAGSVNNASGGTWTTSGNGNFDDPNLLSTNYNVDPQDVLDSVIVLYLTSTGNNGCNPAVDSIILEILSPSPQAIAGPDLTVCADAPFVQLNGAVTGIATGGTWTTNGTGFFSPNANNLGAQYFRSAADTTNGSVTLYLTTTGNGICNPDVDSLIITFTTVPEIDAGPSLSICEDIGFTTLNGQDGGNAVFWTTSGSGTFSDSTSVSSDYTASALDIQDSVITLTLSTTGAGGCQIVTDQTQLFISPAPTVDAGFPQTICADEPSINLNGTVTNANGGLWTTSGAGTFGNDTLLNTTYAPSVGDTTNGFAWLFLEATGASAGCNQRIDSLLLTINDGVSITAGADQLVCLNAQSVTLNGAVTNASGAQWSTINGGGTFSPSASGLNVSYFFAAGDKLQDSIGFVITSVGNGSCFPKQDTNWAIYVPNPVADAGPDVTVCTDAPNVNLTGTVSVTGKGIWSSTGTGMFLPHDSALTVTYVPSSADSVNGGVNISLTSRDNGDCNPSTDFMTVTIIPQPAVDPGPDVLLCFAEADINLNASTQNVSSVYWTTNGDGVFADSTITNARYIFGPNDKSSGSVTLTINSNDINQCIPVSEDIVISFRPEPLVNAGINDTVCADVQFIDLNGAFSGAPSAFWTTSGDGNFTPNTNQAVVSYFFDSLDYVAGTIGMTLNTDASVCPSVSDGINITITPAPTIDVGPDQDVCASEDSVLISAAITVASGVMWTSSGSGVFLPNNSATNAVYVPSAADVNTGTVGLTATTIGNGTCNPVNDQLLLTFRPDPISDAGSNLLACANTTGVQLNGSIFNAGGGIWTSSGTGGFTPDPTDLSALYVPSATDTANGSVSLTLTTTNNLGCPPASNTINLDLQPEPFVTTGNVDACADQTGILLNGQVANSPGVSWSTSGSGVFAPNTASLNPIYSPSAADFGLGTVTLTITTSGSGVCSEVSDDATVIITPLPVANAGEDKTICRNSSTVLSPVIEPGNSYEWYTLDDILISNQAVPTVTASTDTSFVLRVEDINGCEQFDTVNISVVDPPVFNLVDQICFQAGAVLSSNPSFIDTLGTFQWFVNDSLLDGQTNEDVIVSRDGTYTIIYNYESCNQLDSTQVTPLPILEGPDVYVCEDDSAQIITNLYENATYDWSFLGGNAIQSDTNFVSGIATDSIFYEVEVEDSLGCVNRDTILLVPVPPPILTLEDNPACVGDIVTLNAVPTNVLDTGLSKYQWFLDGDILPSDTFETLSVMDSGLYSVVYSLGGCIAEDSANITLNLPAIPQNVNQVEFCKEISDFITLDAGPGGETYYWYYTEDTTQTSEIDDFGFFAFEIINEFGCIAIDSILVTENCPPQVFVPNAFSPNGDGLDDFFRLFGRNYKNLNFKVYNRWGEVVFFADDVEDPWDGNYRGEPLPIGVYPWTAEYEGTYPGQEGPFRLKGSVTIIR